MLKNPANRHKAVGFTFEQWQYTFTNTFTEERGRELYERYHIPASGQIFWASALANIHPGKDDTYVNYKNPDRAPLLFISGSDDHLMPPSIQRSNAKHYKAEGTITEVKEFTGPHLLPSIDGWEQVADYALDWALSHAKTTGLRSCVTGIRVTHIGGPTVVIEAQGWRILTDPTFDPPGKTYKFGWGSKSTKLSGPAIGARRRRTDRRRAGQSRPSRRQPRRRRPCAARCRADGDHHEGRRAAARLSCASASIRGTSHVSKQPASQRSR